MWNVTVCNIYCDLPVLSETLTLVIICCVILLRTSVTKHNPGVQAEEGSTFLRPPHFSDQLWFLFRLLFLTLQGLIKFLRKLERNQQWYCCTLMTDTVLRNWVVNMYLSRCFDPLIFLYENPFLVVSLKTKYRELLI
jgi:hypothetical protein